MPLSFAKEKTKTGVCVCVCMGGWGGDDEKTYSLSFRAGLFDFPSE